MLTNSPTHYGYITRLIHWLMAALFIAMFIIAYIMTNIPKSDFRMSLYDLHKSTGLLLLGLLMIRMTWRYFNIKPDAIHSLPWWQKFTAQMTLVLLYALMLVMPFSGFLTSTLGGHDITIYGILTILPLGHNAAQSAFFAEAHEILSYLLIGFFVLHVLGVLYHHYIMKDATLRRMWRAR